MNAEPRFPDFKPLELADRDHFREALGAFAPRTSELSFTNLFMWREHYQPRWCRLDDWLLVLLAGHPEGACALEPIGPPGRAAASARLLSWLAAQPGTGDPRLERVGRDLVDELAGVPGFDSQATREHFDYVYRTADLIALRGQRYHAKRNHINRFQRRQRYRYTPFEAGLRDECLELAEMWCGLRVCEEDLSLTGEFQAVRQLLLHHAALGVEGGVIRIADRVQAFTLADRLNPDTAVIHVEKANPEYPELYALINQQFAEHALERTEWINREQDLGEPGLRKAKLSYHPDHLEEKHRVRFTAAGR